MGTFVYHFRKLESPILETKQRQHTHEKENYRPVCFINIAVKILHKKTVNRIQQYVTKNVYTYTNTLYEQVEVTAGMQSWFNT